MNSKHYENERIHREMVIQKIGIGNVIARFEIIHKGKKQIHEITDNAIIIVKDCKTKKIITKMIARVPQIKRYYPNGDYPLAVVEIAKKSMKR